MLSVNGFWKRANWSHGERLCFSIFNQARAPIFYENWGVPDTLEGRFDCSSLHLALVLRHLKGPRAQALFDAFFSYTELTLREAGVSDLGVGKQVKKCAKFFYGALHSYEEALDEKANLKEALIRNLYGSIPPLSLKEITEYVRTCDRMLKGQVLDGEISLKWPSLEKKEREICNP